MRGRQLIVVVCSDADRSGSGDRVRTTVEDRRQQTPQDLQDVACCQTQRCKYRPLYKLYIFTIYSATLESSAAKAQKWLHGRR